MLTRRHFIEGLGVWGLTGCATEPPVVPQQPMPAPPSAGGPELQVGTSVVTLERVLARALDTAKRAGASYADARVHKRRHEQLVTREDHLVNVTSSETYGIGVRVLVGGAWGFASSADATEADADEAARRAVAVARAGAGPRKRPIVLAPTETFRDKWQTQFKVDPFAVPLADKAALVLSIWPEAKQVAGIAFCTASCEAFDEWKMLATSEGSLIEQRIVRVGAGYTLTAKDQKKADFVTLVQRVPPRQAGWEHVTGGELAKTARKTAENAIEKLKAARVRPGKRMVILAPDHLWLTIHESIGHSTELDRALGYEANFAGTSFATPDKLGKLRYGGDNITFYADKTTPGGLASSGYDDDGVRTARWDLVKNGLFVAYQTTRDQAAWVGDKASRGSSYAEDHRSVAFQRMPNVSLAPSESKTKLADIIAATDDGVLIFGDGSWSIDQQRYNFQFGGQLFYEIKGGKIAHALRDVAYQSNTLEFWKNCDMIGGPDSWELNGALNDGKGEPSQSNPVSHGCPPCRFRDVNVLDTGKKKA